MTNAWRVWTPGQPLVKKGRASLSAPVFPELDRCDALVKACLENDEKKARELLDEGVSPDILLWGQYSSLLAHTLGRKRFEAAKALLDAGADPLFPVSRYEEFMAARLSDATHALGRAKDDRNWEWVSALLDHVSPLKGGLGVVLQDEWRVLGVELMMKRAPSSVLLGYLEKTGEMGLEPNYKQMFVSLASHIRPDKDAFRVVLRHYQQQNASSDDLQKAIEETLQEASALEFPYSGVPSPSRSLKGIGLGWLIASWVEDHGHDGVLVHWAKRAAAQGQGMLLGKTLLPLLASAGQDEVVVDDLAHEVLRQGRHPGQVFGALDKHFGKEKMDEALRRLDAKASVWRTWLAGKSSSAGAAGSPLVSARRLARAGISIPQCSDRSFLEDCFCVGEVIVKAYEGQKGCDLVDVLVKCGASPSQPNLQNKTPLDILEDAHEKWGKLSHVKVHLTSLQMDAGIPLTGTTQESRSPRPPRF